ncbi:MAG: hypothetical protein GEV08_06430 [Acidimicrobiia bacterium]|nr:hypothetical protein [Acidimicrobiia bacterium]
MDEDEAGGVHLRNEFASVTVSVDRSANGDRLAIVDLRSGQAIFLDPLELERLAWARHDQLAQLVAPADEPDIG